MSSPSTARACAARTIARRDIGFREDESRLRNRQAATNLAVMRHITLGLLKKDKTIKGGIKTKRLVAAWDEDYLAKLLFEQDD